MKVICKRTGNICEMCKLGLIPDITKCKYREEVQEEEQKHNDDYKCGMGHNMTVKELIDRLKNENPDALVYTMDNSDDIALLVTDVSRNILTGKDETVVIH